MSSSVPNRAPQVITAAGAVTPSEINSINAAGAIALTTVAPSLDGQRAIFIDETGHAHTLVCTASLNGGTTSNTLTWNGTKGSSCELISRNGMWWTVALIGVTVS